jgi:serine/threonine protein kinase
VVSFERGTVIAGKYRVERVIGQGGMGVVLAARHLGLDEMVAVKLIRQDLAQGADALARFQREARAAARIKSEHVARVLDVDRSPDGAPYIVMELIDGTDLDALVQRRGALTSEEATAYVLQVCEGLAEAHALDMVHRDLKLKNLFLTKKRDGRPLIKIIDFGVVKFAREATLTGVAALVGSVHYMAPEQIRASNVVDARADVWSLGVCLYTLLTGKLPFDGENMFAVCTSIQGRPAPDVRQLAPHVPDGLAQVVTRALEKDLRRRFANVAELARALAPWSADGAAASRVATILQSNEGELETTVNRQAPVVPVLGRAHSTVDAPEPRPRAKPHRWVFAVIAMATFSGASLAFWPRHPPETTPQAAPAPAPSPEEPKPEVITAPPEPIKADEEKKVVKAPARRPASRPRNPAVSAPPPPKEEPASAYDHF